MDEIWTHWKPHLEEGKARCLFRWWGYEMFPGIENAPFRYVRDGKLPDGETFWTMLQKRKLCLGIGEGPFNEHASHGKARKQGECAATLVAKYLKVDENPALQPILREVTHCDLTDKVRKTQLSSLMKVRYRYTNHEDVITWASTALEALYQHSEKSLAGQTTLQLPREYMEGLVIKYADERIRTYGWDHTEALEQFRRFVSMSEGNSDKTLTELAHLFKVIYGVMGDDVAWDWLHAVLMDLYKDCVQFFATAKVVCSLNTVSVPVSYDGNYEIPLFAATSDSEHLSLAARSRWGGHHAVVVQKTMRGNTAIFLNKYLPIVIDYGISLDPFVAMFRYAEARRNGIYYTGKLSDLCDEVSDIAPNIYYPPDKGSVLNGSTTTPDAVPTKLTLEEIVDIAVNAFHPVRITNWWDRNYEEPPRRPRRSGSTLLVAAAAADMLTNHLPSSQAVQRELEEAFDEDLIPIS